MSETDGSVDSRVGRLASRLDEMEARLGALERRVASAVGGAAGVPGGEGARVASAAAEPRASSEVLPLIGRTLVVLGGAFALRALTEAGTIPQAAGTALGIGYAVLWLALADRASGRGRGRSAAFHALAAAMIGYPLLWEATARFGFLSPPAGAIALAVITALALVVAARRRLLPVAWVFALAATGTALALAVATKMPVLMAWLLLLLGIGTLVLAYVREWRALAWFTGAVVDLAVLMITAMVLLGDPERVSVVVGAFPLVALQLSLVVAYLGTFYVRSVFRKQPVTPGAMVQGVAVLVVGLGGALALTRVTPVSELPLGGVSLLLALASYAASFAFIDRALERRESFVFYTTTALVFTVVGFTVVLEGSTRGISFAAAGLLAAWIGSRRERATLSLHGAVYVLAGAASSRLLESVTEVFTGGAVSTSWIDLPAGVVLAVAAVGSWLPVATHGKTWGRFSRVPRLVLLLVLLLGVGGIAVALGGKALAAGEGADADLAVLATLRTGVLSVAALLLALLGRRDRWPEASWLVYPILLAGAATLLFAALPAGRPVTLFLSFALYGSALILAPRLLRRSRP